ncbi:ribosomal protein S2 [Dictyocaulus viviparus]|uniref:Large ribosomal subunit protein uL4m n=1 Tax=Dictyocaulus viviparus TaxID=29172 RepID=A0A0D8Y2L3_DICVI|nr:ribosomal protein S2 [Dictyocaulus viviparus]
MLSLYQNFGFNLARQRDKLLIILEELNELHEDACKADSISRQILSVHKKYNPFVTFVFMQTLILVVYHIELSFRLDLFAPFEFPYIYWFYGEVVGRWYMTSLEKSRELMKDTLKKEGELYEQLKKNKKKLRSRISHEEHFRTRSAICQDHLILRYGHSAMADATFHLAVALIQMGQIRVPMWNDESERLRFEHRMSFLSCVGEPLHVSYEEFLSRSKIKVLLNGDINVPLQRAIDTFELARNQFEKLIDRPEFNVQTKPLILVCRTNVVVARLMLAGDLRDRRIAWQFMPESPMRLLLKVLGTQYRNVSCNNISRKCSNVAQLKSKHIVPDKETLQKASIRPVLLSDYISAELFVEDKFNFESLVTIHDMFNARLHLGHKIGTLNENMKWALYGERLGVCIFDLDITRTHLIRALHFITHIARRGGIILFISSNRETMFTVEKTAEECGEYSHVRRWQEGTFTNCRSLFGASIRLPDTIIFMNTLTSLGNNHPAILEAAKMAIPTIGVVDSNSDPAYLTYLVPANDDSSQSVEFLLSFLQNGSLLQSFQGSYCARKGSSSRNGIRLESKWVETLRQFVYSISLRCKAWVVSFDAVEERKLGLIDLHPDVFRVPPRLDILHRNLTWQTMYRNVQLTKQLSRAEMPGGGRKPWPQKKTGRAHVGSIRCPQFKNGGFANGVRGPRTWFYILPDSIRLKGSLCVALTLKHAQDCLHIVDRFDQLPTEADAQFLHDLADSRNWGYSVLFVSETDKISGGLAAAIAELPSFTAMPVYGLNCFSLMKYDTVVLSRGAVDLLEERLLRQLHRAGPLNKKYRYIDYKERILNEAEGEDDSLQAPIV